MNRLAKIFEVIVAVFWLFLTVNSALATSNITTGTEDKVFTTALNITITNTTIYIVTESGTVSYPNIGGYNYSYDTSLTRTINITYYYFSTISMDSNLTCPEPICNLSYTLGCPNTTINESDIITELNSYIDTNIKPDVAELNEFKSKHQICLDDLFMVKNNLSDSLSVLGKYESDANYYEELYESEKSSKTPLVLMIVIIGCLLLFITWLQISGGNFNSLFRRKPI